MDIRNMPAGREMDALVAEHVMGFRREKTPPDCNGEYGGEDILVPPNIDHDTWHYPPKGRISLTFFVPQYSTDIATAWAVLEKFRYYEIKSYPHMNVIAEVLNEKEWCKATGETAPLAICRAALLAVKRG